jgi:predicted dehydrogenase
MEKPPCHSEEVGAEIKELLARSNLVHSVGFPTRYEPSLDAALQQINGERLGMVQILMATPMAIQPILDRYPDGYLVERSGGVAGDQGIHYVDIARYIARSEVKTARALGTNRVLPVSAQVTTRDTAGWVLEMANGVVVTHAHTWCASNWTCQIRLITDRSDVTVNGFGDLLGQFEAEHRAFLAAVASGDMRTVRSTYPDALESFRVTEEINRQLYENPVAS